MNWYVSQEVYNIIVVLALFIFVGWISILVDEYYKKRYGKSIFEDPYLEGDEIGDRDKD